LAGSWNGSKPMRTFDCVLVTGGAGFIGGHFIRSLFSRPEFRGRLVNLDALTYAGNLESLQDVMADRGGRGDARHTFVRADITDRAAVERVFAEQKPDAVVHFAAESHVDRSIVSADEFVRTNVLGTFTLLDVASRAWQSRRDVLFHHVSTDEVYGSLGRTGAFTEATPYDPRSPYSASKAGSDHLVMAWHATHGLPVTLSNCSNNYGPFQFPEKLVPLMILNMLEGKELPVYGDGGNVRDWLYVEDHVSAVWKIMTEGTIGQKYNVGGENQWENIRLVRELCRVVAQQTGNPATQYERLITFVKDRPGHDRRYAIDSSKIQRELGWRPSVTFEQGLERTVRWYRENQAWVDHVRSGEYADWITRNYGER
jgi:dTDP-glucose 4,6-dehydratase